MRRSLIALTLGALAAAAVAAPASAATTRMVDDDGRASPGNCSGNGPAHNKIQKAVDAAGAGDTILVCPGTYREQVTISAAKDRLSLRSVVNRGATIRSPGTLQPDAGTSAMVLIGAGANRVTVQGFRLLHRASLVPATSGVPPFGVCGPGIAIQVDGTRARIISNSIRAAGPGTLGECGLGIGIAVGYNDAPGGDDGASASVRFNNVRDFLAGGIAVGGDGSRMSAFRNVVRYYHLGATRDQVATGAIQRVARWLPATRSPAGRPISILAAGIVAFDGADATFTGNTTESGPGAGPLAQNKRPYLWLGIGAEGADEVVIKNNRAYRSDAGIGIGAFPLTAGASGQPIAGPIVRDNLAVQNDVGILVNATDGIIRGNRANSNAVGLFAWPSTSDTLFEDNVAATNFSWDCLDESSGSGTANTANTWNDNQGISDSPDGICQPPFNP